MRNGFKIEPTISPLMSENDAFAQEKALILKYGRADLGTGTLLNLTDGGEGPSGAIRSKETREKIRFKNIGRKLSDEIKLKISKKSTLSGLTKV